MSFLSSFHAQFHQQRAGLLLSNQKSVFFRHNQNYPCLLLDQLPDIRLKRSISELELLFSKLLQSYPYIFQKSQLKLQSPLNFLRIR